MTYLWILLAVSLAVSAVGFKYFIYFFSIGYGYGISALAVTTGILFYNSLTASAIAALAVLFVFGCRLGTYLVLRERRSKAYNKILHAPELKKKKPIGVILTVWLFCALLYVGQVSPVVFRLDSISAGKVVNDLWCWIGVVLMSCGVIIETIADMQKTAAKKHNTHRFVDTGLYRIVRCPNYLGEVTLWTGCLLIAIVASLTIWQWVIVIIGYIGIIYVMFSGARRLELRQDEVYGNDPEYQDYIKRTPILLPFIPIYSVKKYKWLQA